MQERNSYVKPAVRAFALGGIGMVSIGAAGVGFLVAERAEPLAPILRALSLNMIVVGVLLLVYAALRAKGRSIEEAYRLGYDVGYENGFRSGFDTVHDERATRDELARRREHPAVGDRH